MTKEVQNEISLEFDPDEWIPEKTLLKSDNKYEIYSSGPSIEFSDTVQFTIRKRDAHGDLLRMDSYKKGYFGANWASSISLLTFLESSETFMDRFLLKEDNELSDSPDHKYVVAIFSKTNDPAFYNFNRPILESDFEDEDVSSLENINLIRVESPIAAFTWEPITKCVGIVAWVNKDSITQIAESTGRFVNETQPELSEKVIIETINLLPYMQKEDTE